jgi:hypothetical protein
MIHVVYHLLCKDCKYKSKNDILKPKTSALNRSKQMIQRSNEWRIKFLKIIWKYETWQNLLRIILSLHQSFSRKKKCRIQRSTRKSSVVFFYFFLLNILMRLMSHKLMPSKKKFLCMKLHELYFPFKIFEYANTLHSSLY